MRRPDTVSAMDTLEVTSSIVVSLKQVFFLADSVAYVPTYFTD